MEMNPVLAPSWRIRMTKCLILVFSEWEGSSMASLRSLDFLIGEVDFNHCLSHALYGSGERSLFPQIMMRGGINRGGGELQFRDRAQHECGGQDASVQRHAHTVGDKWARIGAHALPENRC